MAAAGLLRASELLRRQLGEAVHPHGITLQQYNVLRILRSAGSEGLPTLEIGSRLVEEAPGITRLLDRLERKGLVERHRCPRDARRVLCGIAAAGTRALQELERPVRQASDEFLSPLSAEEGRRLIRLLQKFAPHCQGGYRR